MYWFCNHGEFMRKDLTNWIIHFVHDATNKHLSANLDIDTIPDLLSKLSQYNNEDTEEEIMCGHYISDVRLSEFYNSRLTAFEVLRKIIRDGFIKSTWSLRNGQPTIYGLKSTVCFTEMPLYALLKYAQQRSDSKSMTRYGIAFLRQDVFKAKVRPVIYGLTNKHKEYSDTDFFRILDDDCGIGLSEQYRYVEFNLDRKPRIDWTHEREWRWGGIEDYGIPADVPGFPLFEDAKDYAFSRILFIVETNTEAELIIDDLRRVYDSESNDSYLINKQSVKNAKVLSFEKLKALKISNEDVTIDKLPLYQLPEVSFRQPNINKEKFIIDAIEKAQVIYENTSEKIIKEVGKEQFNPLCGFGFVATEETNTDTTRILVNKGMAQPDLESGSYIVHSIGRSKTQNMEINFLSAVAAAKFLTAELRQKFIAIKKLD